MSFSYDPSTVVGQIRDVIGDNDASAYFLSDETINQFYTTYGTIFRAAAFCLRSIANKKLLTGKDEKAGNYSQSTASYIRMLKEQADALEKLDQETPADAQSEVIYNDFNYRQILTNKVLRREPLDNS